jgi:protein-S-isoprenylcysteine O-methyltransferase Ste14
MTFLFSGIIISVDKIVFLIYMITMIKIGINQEEKKLLRIFPNTYSKYIL